MIDTEHDLEKKIKTLEEENIKLKEALENERKKNKEEVEKLENYIKSFIIKSNISLVEQNQKSLLNKDVIAALVLFSVAFKSTTILLGFSIRSQIALTPKQLPKASISMLV